MMKIFDKATVKLTAIYTIIIMVVSLSFSMGIGMTAMGEIRRPYKTPDLIVQLRVESDFANVYNHRVHDVETKVWASLFWINVGILIAGAMASYLLARRTLKPIEKAMEDETQFVSDASHELRTPLATMRMENEVLLRDDEAKKSDYKEQLKSNLEEIDKLRQLTDTLLKLSGSGKLELATIDASEMVGRAIDRVQATAEAKKITIDDQLGDKSLKLVANADALIEILYIYLDNAIKYSPENSQIEIISDGKKSLVVRDHGSGIADKDLPNVFNRFYRADESRNSEGFGLGLSLASRLAEQMGARVSATNNPSRYGSGATFTICF